MTDVLLDTAIANWEPRFTANGVDPSDYARITKSLERWDDWCQAWSDGAEEHLALAKAALDENRGRSAGEALARAAVYFHFGKFLFVHDREQAYAAQRRAVDALTQALPLLSPSATRHEIDFDGSAIVGLLRTPTGPGPHATVILIPGLDSTKEEFREVERHFLDRHMATFSIDGPGQGEAEWTLPIRPDWEVVGGAIVTHLLSLPEVDPSRIGVWGVSLGGYYATRVASGELPIRATIALSGPYSLGASWSNLNPLTRHAFQVRSYSSSPEAAERRSMDVTLEGRTSKITAPILVIVGQRDRLFSWHDGERVVNEARGPAELLVLETGNHGCANVSYRHRPFSADWMARQLDVDQSTTI